MRIGSARPVYVNVPEQSAEKAYTSVIEVTVSAAETLNRTCVPLEVVPVHSPA